MASRHSFNFAVYHGSQRPAGTHGGFVYRLARRLEAYSFAAAPEQLAVLEGLRAAIAVAGLVALAAGLHRPMLSWAAFGAFWTCLADPGGPNRRRLACMGGFAAAGSVAACLASAAGQAGMVPSACALLALIFLAGLSGAYGAAVAQVGTLTAVVAVVAVAFPQTPLGAMALSGTFLLGSLCALVLCIGVWRLHPYAAARRALDAVYLRLGDMLDALLTLDLEDVAADMRSRAEAEHRRAVRAAIERARAVNLDLQDAARYRGELDTADRLFAALIAASHDRDVRDVAFSLSERRQLRRLSLLLAETRHQTSLRTPRPKLLAQKALLLRRAADATATVTGRAVAMASGALADQAQVWRSGPAAAACPERPAITVIRPVPAAILRHAGRLAIAVCLAFATAAALGLNFSYWATMSTVLVVQPVAAATWPRSLERILGSIAGGLLAWLVIALAPTPPAILLAIFPVATATIALRRVNYSLYAIGVTCLFILVAELLQPAPGLAETRMINSLIGSVVGAAAVFLWPGRVTDGLAAKLAEALAANFALAARAVVFENTTEAFDIARRAAGVASNAAETTCRQCALAGQSRRRHLGEATNLLAALRRLAGAAMVQALTGGAPDPARAAAIEQVAASQAAALRNLTSLEAIPPLQPDDDLSAALRNVTDMAAAYLTSIRSPRRSVP